MCEKRDGEFIFKGNLLSRLPNNVELSYNWVLTNFKYQEPYFYSIFFDDSERRPFEVPTGRTNKYENKLVTDSPKLYDLKGGNISHVFY